VIFGKILDDEERKCLVLDIESGVAKSILPYPWQSDTCIGSWHYNRGIYNRNAYKSASDVIHLLADIVSKNGKLLLNIPVRGDGTIDEKEEKVLDGIAAWMDVNKEAIFGTQPWKTFGEGPATPAKGTGASSNVGVRFTAKDGVLYAIVLGVPDKTLAIKSLAAKSGTAGPMVADVAQLGSPEKVPWKQDDDALRIEPSGQKPYGDAGVVYKITLR
jgi:alpha-L-fucosidase